MNKTKNKIANAFLILLDSKGDDQITNNEIIENAGISKGTFYNNFDSQQAIAHFIFHEIDSKIIHAIIEQRTTLMVSNSADLLLKCVADATIPAIYNQREKIRILYKSSINGEWKHYLEGKVLKNDQSVYRSFEFESAVAPANFKVWTGHYRIVDHEPTSDPSGRIH